MSVFALLAMLSGCATTTGPMAKVDPFEPWNRAMYDVNEVVDGKFFKPIAQAYVEYTPKPIQYVIRNVFNNIDDLFSAINGILSGKFDSAGHDLGRVIVNTLAGIGGIFDVASEAGIPRGNLDFGLTFGTWGFPQGPYLFVPLVGPTTVRDGVGLGVRFWFGPVGYIPDVPLRNSLYGVGAVDLRAGALETESLLDQAALDRYAFIRRAYLQRRLYLLYGGKVPPEKEEE
jgi:phospholipid-binding lipoprotein MlaA